MPSTATASASVRPSSRQARGDRKKRVVPGQVAAELTHAQVVAIFRQHGDQVQRALLRQIHRAGPMGLELLASILVEESAPSVIRWAVEGLGAFRGKRVERLLRRALKHPAMSVRLHAMLAIAATGERTLLPAMRPLLRDPSGGIRLNAIDIIAPLRPRWFEPELRHALQDEKAYVRQRAAALLESLFRDGQPVRADRPSILR